MGRSMDWTLEDNMVDSLFFCATLTGRRGFHTSFVQTGAETPNIGAKTVKPDPGSSWEGHSGGGRRCRGWNGQPLCIPSVICPVRRTYVIVVRWNELLCGGLQMGVSGWGTVHSHSVGRCRGEIGPERSGAATQSFSQRRSSSSGSCLSQQKWLKLHSTVRVFLVLGRSKT